MKKLYNVLILLTLLLLLLSSCDNIKNNNTKINVYSSFTIISDITSEIGKDKVNVHNLVPSGTDPHEYEVLYDDLKALAHADLLFYFGLNLEGGSNGWYFKTLKSQNKNLDHLYELSDGITPLYLNDKNEINPHAFISPLNGIIIANNIKTALIAYDPINTAYYENNANIYINKLQLIANEYLNTFNNIPENKRILVTSERAFQYLANDYHLTEAYIWAIDTEETGTKKQIKDLVDFLANKDINYLFVESNVDTRPMETVSLELKIQYNKTIPIYHDVLYSDEIGAKGTLVDSYIKFLNHNINVLREGMK